MTLKIVKIGKQLKNKSLKNVEAIYNEMKFLQKKDREHFYVLHLNVKLNLIGKELISIGSLTAASVHPREVFKGAILSNSASIICVHNHPSGDPTPSNDDVSITDKLKKTGEVIGIPVLDHIIIGANSYISIMEQSLKNQSAQIENEKIDIFNLFDKISAHLGFCKNTFTIINKFNEDASSKVDDTYGWILNEATNKLDKADILFNESLYNQVKKMMEDHEAQKRVV